MPSDAPFTYYGSVVTLGPTDVDVSDDAAEFTLDSESKIASVEVLGPSGVRTARGPNTWSGNIQAVYDASGGPSTAYNLLQTEYLVPTKAGFKMILKPVVGSGEEIITLYAVLSGRKPQGNKPSDLQVMQFPFTVNGQPAFTAQT